MNLPHATEMNKLASKPKPVSVPDWLIRGIKEAAADGKFSITLDWPENGTKIEQALRAVGYTVTSANHRNGATMTIKWGMTPIEAVEAYYSK